MADCRYCRNADDCQYIVAPDDCEDFEETFEHHWEMMDDIEREEYMRAESEGEGMKLLIDIPDNTYDAIMARDWKNAGRLFSDELKAIHDGKPFVEVLQEIRHEIETAQTYKIASGSHDLYIDRDNALEIIDSHIEQYKEDAE